MNLKNRVLAYFQEEGEKLGIKKPTKIRDFSVNISKNKEYPRNVYYSFEKALQEVIRLGGGFNIRAGFSGGWSIGATSGTGDFSIGLPENIFYQFMYEDSLEKE